MTGLERPVDLQADGSEGCVTEEQLGNAHLSEEQKEEKARDLYSQAEVLAAEKKWSEAALLYEQAYYLVPSKVGFAHKVGLAAYEAWFLRKTRGLS